jgi:hypothetical protein
MHGKVNEEEQLDELSGAGAAEIGEFAFSGAKSLYKFLKPKLFEPTEVPVEIPSISPGKIIPKTEPEVPTKPGKIVPKPEPEVPTKPKTPTEKPEPQKKPEVVPEPTQPPQPGHDPAPIVPTEPTPKTTPAKPGVETTPAPAPKPGTAPAPAPKPAPATKPVPAPEPAPAPKPAPGPAASPKPPVNVKTPTKLTPRLPIVLPKLSGNFDTHPHSEYHSVPVPIVIGQARLHRTFREETNTRRKDSSKELVGRPNSAGVKDPESVLARNASIKSKIIDEEQKLAAVVKSVVKKKKEEKEGGPNPLVDFDPKLNHKFDNEN